MQEEAPVWVCLDVGETLVDESRVWATWADVLDVPRFTLMAVLGAVVAGGGDHRAAFRRLGRPDWPDLVDEVERRFGGFAEQDLYPDARACLDRLASSDHRVAVIANQPARRHRELSALGIQPDVMAMSEALGVAKPDPAFFAAALRAMGDPAPAAVVYVGDRLDNDIRPAAAAGLRTCWIRRGPWAYLQDDADVRADLVIDSLDELLTAVGEAFDWS